MGIHVGAKTHSHDHAITLVSLRTMKTRVSRPEKPTPLYVAEELSDIHPP